LAGDASAHRPRPAPLSVRPVSNITQAQPCAQDSFVMTLAGGSLIFLAFVVFYTLVVIYSLYTRTGSGINQRPWGEEGYSSLSHDETTTSLWRR
jgi:hypothetical protein